MIIFQSVIDNTTTNGKYNVSLASYNGLVSFDLLNDSPYNVAVNFGTDPGYNGSEYYVPPHGILLGIQATPSKNTIGQAWFSGKIFLNVQAPAGGTVILSQAPASQFTIIGYAIGARPANTVTMSRMSNVSNTVNSVGGTASAIQNDTNAAGTSIVESTVNGDNASAVSITNDGQASFGTGINPGSLRVKGSSGTSGWLDKTGNFTVGTGLSITANLIQAQNANDLGLHANSGQRVVSTINGVDTFSVNGNGANLLSGSLALLVGSISRISIQTLAITTTLTAYNHNLGVVPRAVIMQLIGTSTATATGKFDNGSMTTTTVSMISSVNATYCVICIA